MLQARIIGKNPNGDIIIRPESNDDYQDIEKLISQRKMLLDLRAFDINRLSRLQQQKAHALMHDINDYSNNDPYIFAEWDLKTKFAIRYGLPTDRLLSLEDCSKDVATMFIAWLVEYCFHYDIPFKNKDLHLTFDLNRLMFLCAVHNRCFVSSMRRQDRVLHIHHVNEVGMGNDRRKIDHRGRYFLILEAIYHEEIHKLGYTLFAEKYHVGAIVLSDQQLIDFKLMSRSQMAEFDDQEEYEIKSWQLPEID